MSNTHINLTFVVPNSSYLCEMTVKEMIDTGVMTLREMDALVKENGERANRFGVRLVWELQGKDVVGKVFHEKRLLQEKRYSSGYQHRRQAMMHLDFYYFLNIKQRQYNEIQNLKKQELANIEAEKKNAERAEHHKAQLGHQIEANEREQRKNKTR